MFRMLYLFSTSIYVTDDYSKYKAKIRIKNIGWSDIIVSFQFQFQQKYAQDISRMPI